MILRSLPLRVLAVGFIVLALPLLIDSFIFFQRAYNASILDAKETLRETANFRAFAISELDPLNPVVVGELEVLLNLKNEELAIEDINKKLTFVNEISRELEISILDLSQNGNYKILASSNSSLVNSNYNTPFLLKMVLANKDKGDFVRFRYPNPDSPYVPIITLAKVIRSQSGKPQGILVISAPIQEAIAPMIEKVKEHNLWINFAVLSNDKIIFAASDPSIKGQYLAPITPERAAQIGVVKPFGNIALAKNPLPIISSGNDSFFEFIFNDQVQIAYAIAIPKINLFFMAYTTKENLFSNSIKHFLWIYTIYGLIFVLGGTISYWLSTWISRPLMQLCQLMERVGQGDFGVRFKEEPLGFEINILGNIFNQTLDSLFENIQKAEDERVLKETLRKELELGEQVQRNLLPQKKIDISGLDFEALYISPKEVGGDFYDIFLKNEKQVALVVADASDKGISACLYALSVRSLLRTYLTLHDDVGTILSNTNNMFSKDTGDSGMFVTVLMGIYDVEKKVLSYYSCGHVPGIIRRSNGQLVILNHSGMAMGLKDSTPFKEDSVQLYSGDLILFYTDGLIDATNEKHQHFSEKRLRNFLQQNKLESPQQVIVGLKKEIEAFCNGISQEDEVTILCIKVL